MSNFVFFYLNQLLIFAAVYSRRGRAEFMKAVKARHVIIKGILAVWTHSPSATVVRAGVFAKKERDNRKRNKRVHNK